MASLQAMRVTQLSLGNLARTQQRYLMTHPDYRHPAHWAAFVLVGNCF
ncbi:MAG: hypothetical protein HC934_05570 [Acaryochloridaceae cyanobacterium SU_2_1]|nr:hypothetical protein [Acaryochloridaceae cyanobacterium SU_2_1]